MNISDQGIRLLIDREAKRNDAYLDSKGIPTIGVGHTGPDIHIGLHWTDEQIEEAFRQDLAWVEEAIADHVTVPLEQFQHDALASFILNIGSSAFVSSTLLRKLNENDIHGAANEFDRWHIPPEITSRRNGEKAQFEGLAFEARITTAVA